MPVFRRDDAPSNIFNKEDSTDEEEDESLRRFLRADFNLLLPFFVGITVYNFGMLFSGFLLQMGTTTTFTALIYSLGLVVSCLISAVMEPLVVAFGWRRVAVALGAVYSVALVVSAFATSALFLFFSSFAADLVKSDSEFSVYYLFPRYYFKIYCRYIGDIFIKTKSHYETEQLKLCLQDTSGLTFTIESSSDKSMPFLNVFVTQHEECYNTNVYVKPTNTGHCLNGESENPQRCKESTIGAYIGRALTHCSTWQLVHKEIERCTQVLISNGFSERDINRQTKTIMESCPSQTKETIQKSHVVYRITCKRGNCEVLPSSYIGMTTTKLSRCLTCHLTSGAQKNHLLEKHGITIARKFLKENTEVVDMCADVWRLPILEALFIKYINPKLNVQAHDLQALPSMRRKKGSDIQLPVTQSREKQKSSTNERRPLTRDAARLLLK
ncbi:hypothetical protein GWK47_013339 [Chionoecetes opilio]|uniref:Helix-turn-helix domain-containing protein n=1 Tax=Chionoecetes opilio TaxID=41210 RepID=A0A8J4Y177_CHIOP|nr:hypothetical protein GWK47_013339 [Chionoecetes opilio]